MLTMLIHHLTTPLESLGKEGFYFWTVFLVLYFYNLAYTKPAPWQALSKFTYRATEGVSQVITKMVTSNSLSLSDYLESIDFEDIDMDSIMDNITSANLKSKEFAVLFVCTFACVFQFLCVSLFVC